MLINMVFLILIPLIVCYISLKEDDNVVFTLLITTIVSFIGYLVVFAIGKYLFQVDYLKTYYQIVDETNKLFVESFEYEMQMQMDNIGIEYYYQVKDMLDIIFYEIKYLFMGMLFIFCFIVSFVEILFISFINKYFKFTKIDLRKLLNFKTPRIIPIIYIVSYFSIGYTKPNEEIYNALLSNIMIVSNFILILIGIVVVIKLIKNVDKSTKLKVLFIVLFCFALLLNPQVFLLIAIAEGIFGFTRLKKNEKS